MTTKKEKYTVEDILLGIIGILKSKCNHVELEQLERMSTALGASAVPVLTEVKTDGEDRK